MRLHRNDVKRCCSRPIHVSRLHFAVYDGPHKLRSLWSTWVYAYAYVCHRQKGPLDVEPDANQESTSRGFALNIQWMSARQRQIVTTSLPCLPSPV